MQKGKAFKALSIMHKGMLISVILLGAVMFWLVSSNMVAPPSPDLDRMLQVAAIVLGVLGFFGGAALFKKRLQAIRDMNASAEEKWKNYFAVCLLQWALLEGPAIFCMISFFLTGNYAFIVLGGLLLLILAMQGPSKMKIMLQLGISEEELNEL
jgi:hypothetical protein